MEIFITTVVYILIGLIVIFEILFTLLLAYTNFILRLTRDVIIEHNNKEND